MSCILAPGGGAKIVKPVMRRQVSAPGVSSNDHMTKPSVITNQAPANSPTRRGRERSKYIALVPLCCIAVKDGFSRQLNAG